MLFPPKLEYSNIKYKKPKLYKLQLQSHYEFNHILLNWPSLIVHDNRIF